MLSKKDFRESISSDIHTTNQPVQRKRLFTTLERIFKDSEECVLYEEYIQHILRELNANSIDLSQHPETTKYITFLIDYYPANDTVWEEVPILAEAHLLDLMGEIHKHDRWYEKLRSANYMLRHSDVTEGKILDALTRLEDTTGTGLKYVFHSRLMKNIQKWMQRRKINV